MRRDGVGLRPPIYLLTSAPESMMTSRLTGQLLYDKDCKSIGQKYGKTAAQVALRWLVQHRVTFTTESSTAKHFREDLEIFDFVLTDKEMQRLDAK